VRVRGRAWKLGDNITTDHIISGKHKFTSVSRLEDMLPHLFEEVIPGFHEKVEEGDVVVAGRNFGAGSSREHAPRLLKMAGVGAIVAKGFARIFFRNAINVGLPVVVARRVPDITETGDIIEVDLGRGIVRNVSKGCEERFKPYPREILLLLEEGGVLEYLKRHGGLPWAGSTG